MEEVVLAGPGVEVVETDPIVLSRESEDNPRPEGVNGEGVCTCHVRVDRRSPWANFGLTVVSPGEKFS